MFRHAYREERFWSDLAPKQPEAATHACLLQFLGAADKLYPKQLQEQIDKRKQLQRLQGRREEFDEVLRETVREVVPEMSSSGPLTLASIEEAVVRINGEIEQQRRRRDAVMAELLRSDGGGLPFDSALADERVRIASERDEESRKLAEADRRIAELTEFRERVRAELGRNQRTQVAGHLLSPLRVTCCPNCDQTVRPGAEAPGDCFVCHQPMPDRGSGLAAAKRRLEFEAEQLRGEESELGDLLDRLAQERETLAGNVRRLDEQLARIEARLRPLRVAVGAMIPPEVAAIDTQVGQYGERIAQINRLRGTVALRDDLDRQIEQLLSEVETLTEDLDAKYDSVDFEAISEELSNGANEYLDRLNESHPGSWTHQRVRFRLGKKPDSLKLLVGEAPWTTVGATSTGFVLLGYHYALLRLTGRDSFNYPGIALIDFPMTFAKGMSVADKENYLIEPFVRLAGENPNIQVVVCGRAFTGLTGVNRIELTRVWEQGDALPESSCDADARQE